MLSPIEAIADAIMNHEGWFAGSRSNRNRNPGNLRDSHLKSGMDPGGYATFETLAMGYTALVLDLEGKFSGHTSTGLGPDSTIQELMDVYAPALDHNNPAVYAEKLCDWVSVALNRTATPETQLKELWQPVGEV